MLNNKTPHEVLLGKIPSYKHLKVFGYLAYAFDSLGKQDKFAEREEDLVYFLLIRWDKRDINYMILKIRRLM